MGNVARWKYQNVPRLEFDHQTQFIEDKLTTFPIPKRNHYTKQFVNPITVSIAGYTKVDDHSSKGVADRKITKTETTTVDLNLLIFLWK